MATCNTSDAAAQANSEHLLRSHEESAALATEMYCITPTVQNRKQRVRLYWAFDLPHAQPRGHPRRAITSTLEAARYATVAFGVSSVGEGSSKPDLGDEIAVICCTALGRFLRL